MIWERFWSSVRVVDGDGCWEWTGTIDENGYGRVGIGRGRKMRAHRMSLIMAVGPIGDLMACHTCDNPACVRPSHLYAGDAKQNMHDRDTRGRNGKAVLTPDTVVAIREAVHSGATLAATSAAFGVCVQRISMIAIGDTWQHVGGPRTPRRSGDNTRSAKITRAVAEAIRARKGSGKSQSHIAAEFGVSQSLVSLIMLDQVWPTSRRPAEEVAC